MTDIEQRWRAVLPLVVGLSLTLLFFYMMAPFLVPILLGAVLAIIAYPAYEKTAKFTPKWVSAGLVTLGMALGLIAPVVTVLYVGSTKILHQISNLAIFHESNIGNLVYDGTFRNLIETLKSFFPVEPEWIETQALELLRLVVQKVSVGATYAVSATPGLLLSLTVVALSFYFFLLDGNGFLSFLLRLSPFDSNRSRSLYQVFEQSCRGVVLSLAASCGVQGLLMFIAFLVLGVPSALLFGFVTILFGIIPIVGTAPVWIGTAIYLFAQKGLAFGIIMVCVGILISSTDNFIRPWVMKGHSEMHPLLALVSVFGAISLVGPMGIFLGPIIAAVFVAFLDMMTSEPLKLT